MFLASVSSQRTQDGTQHSFVPGIHQAPSDQLFRVVIINAPCASLGDTGKQAAVNAQDNADGPGSHDPSSLKKRSRKEVSVSWLDLRNAINQPDSLGLLFSFMTDATLLKRRGQMCGLRNFVQTTWPFTLTRKKI